MSAADELAKVRHLRERQASYAAVCAEFLLEGRPDMAMRAAKGYEELGQQADKADRRNHSRVSIQPDTFTSGP